MASSLESQARLTVPNIITVARILLTPLFIILLIQKHYHQALWVFVLAGISDMVDGLIARRWQQKSPLGAFLDPLADKLLMCSSFVTLSIYHLIPSWLTVIVISRDVILVLGVLLFKMVNFPVVVRPSLAGKLSTTTQIATVLLVLIAIAKSWSVSTIPLQAWFWLTGAFTTISGLHYIVQALKGATSPHNSSQ
jgi:cardiolipin synthase (CMP-forming)